MPARSVAAGSVSFSAILFLQDTTAGNASVGLGLAGLTSASSGLQAWYARTRGSSTSIGLTPLGSATAGWTSGGFIGVDSVNMKGVYRLDVPDAAFASGADQVILNFPAVSALNLAQADVLYEITGWNNQNAVSGGLSAFGSVSVGTGGADSAAFTTNAVTRLQGGLATSAGLGSVTVGTNSDKTGYALTVTPPTAAQTATAVMASTVAGKSLTDAIRYVGAVCAGTITDAGTGTEIFTDFAGTPAVTITVDATGNRSNVVYS